MGWASPRIAVAGRVGIRQLIAAAAIAAIVLGGTSVAPARAATVPTAPVDHPFADDPLHLAAYHPISTGYHAEPRQTWRVYSCDTTKYTGRVPSDTAAVAAWSEPVGEWMQWASEGRYQPTFVASGKLTGTSRLDCADKAAARLSAAERSARTGLIILHDEFAASEGGAYGLSSPMPKSIVNGQVVLPADARPPRITLTGGGVDEEWRWSLVVHEIGHALGWNHLPYEGGAAYGNANDVMSGIAGVGTAAWNRYAAGWISPSQVEIHRSGTVNYRLGAPGTGRTQMVVLPSDEVGLLYTISARGDTTYDNGATRGVEVHRVDQSLIDASSHCVSESGVGACFGTATNISAVVPNGSVDYQAASWQVGESIRIGAVTATVTKSHGDGFTVSVAGTAPALWSAGAAAVDPDYVPQAPAPNQPAPPAAPTPTSPAPSSGPFADVTADNPHAESVSWLAESGITSGCNPPDNTRFCPDQALTRGQMAAFLSRALQLPDGDATFADTTSHVFAADIARLADANITKGCNPPDNTRFCPDRPVTRAEMATFLYRVLG